LSVFKKNIDAMVDATAYSLKQKKKKWFCYLSFNFYGCESVRFSRLEATDRTVVDSGFMVKEKMKYHFTPSQPNTKHHFVSLQ